MRVKEAVITSVLGIVKLFQITCNIAIPSASVIGGALLIEQDYVLFGLCCWGTAFYWLSEWLDFDEKTERLINKLKK